MRTSILPSGSSTASSSVSTTTSTPPIPIPAGIVTLSGNASVAKSPVLPLVSNVTVISCLMVPLRLTLNVAEAPSVMVLSG